MMPSLATYTGILSVPDLPVTDDTRLRIARRTIGRRLWAVGLASLAAKITRRAAEAKLGAADIQRASLVHRGCVLAALSGGIAVGLAACPAVRRSVAAPAALTAAGAVAAW